MEQNNQPPQAQTKKLVYCRKTKLKNNKNKKWCVNRREHESRFKK